MIQIVGMVVVGWITGIILNMLADRLPAGQVGRSLCQTCETILPWEAQSVLVATVAGKQNCPSCGQRIVDGRKIAVEIVTPLLFLLATVTSNSLAACIFRAVFLSIFLLVAIIDLEHHKVLNKVLFVALLVAIVGIGSGVLPPWRSALLGFVINGTLMTIIAIIGKGALGSGDVKLSFVLGAILGYPAAPIALAYGIILGGVAVSVLVLAKKLSMRDYTPYAPYLVIPAALFLLH